MKSNEIYKAIEQYEPSLHDVMKPNKRENKHVVHRIPTNDFDDEGKRIYKVQAGEVPITRIPLNLVQYGATQKAVFAVGQGVRLNPREDDVRAFDYFLRNWKDSKIESDLVEILRTRFAETECAVIFWGERGAEKLEDFKFRYKILSPTRGDQMEVLFNAENDDMVGFKRTYQLGDKGVTDYYYKDVTGVYLQRDKEEPKKLPYQDLPIVYFNQKQGEFIDSKALLDGLELITSDGVETFQYFGSPILWLKGESLELPQKGDMGKVLAADGEGADAKFLTPNGSTELQELLIKQLKSMFFLQNRIAPLSFEELKEMGDVSGTALDRLLIDPQIEATLNQKGEFGKGVQRLVNWLVREWSELTNERLKVDVEFNRFTLESESEKIAVRMSANGGLPIEDIETSLEKLGVINVEERVSKLYNSTIEK